MGLYFLFGASEESSDVRYIGQTGNAGNRLKQHTANKDYWERALVAVSLANTWTDTHVGYMEWKAIDQALRSERFRLLNGSGASNRHTPAPLEADCNECLDTISVLLTTLGFRRWSPFRKEILHPLRPSRLQRRPTSSRSRVNTAPPDSKTIGAVEGPGLMNVDSPKPCASHRSSGCHLHGWPGLRARDLMMLGMELARGEGRLVDSWPLAVTHDYSRWGRTDTLVRNPHDDGVWLGGARSVARAAELGIDAVVSLCRLGTGDVPGVAAADHATFWVIHSFEAGANAHPDFVPREATAAGRPRRRTGRSRRGWG